MTEQGGADRAIGERIAETRQQRDLRQDDFLALMKARGVLWTRTTLSRIESGHRALKAVELFAVADALGLGADALNPESGTLAYAIQRMRIRYGEKKQDLQILIGEVEMAREGLTAVLLMREIVSGKTEFRINGAPGQFMEYLMFGFSDFSNSLSDDRALREIHKSLGIDHDEYLALTGRDSSPEYGFEDVDYDAYRELFAGLYPDLQFTGEDHAQFFVEGLKVPEDGG